MTGTVAPMKVDINPGEHVIGHFAGMSFNLDTIWTTVIAGLIVVALGFWARSALTKPEVNYVPTKIQLIWEAIVNEVTTQVEDNLGRVNPFVVPLAVALFFFILIANWLELIPSELNHISPKAHLLPAPTADTNLTYAMAIMVMVGVWTYGIREKGLGGYLKHFLEPYPVLLPLNVLEELVKPITLALRLFGNIFAGGIMLALIASIPGWGLWLPNIIWKLFDMFIGGIQAFIFALLTVLYFGMAGAKHADHDEKHDKTSADPQVDSGADAESKEATPVLAH
ncbi:MAG: synthase subcomplex subunit [Marmoricola sp.]|nr:synthase subcomplex subunit [Marmoricola sp.]